MVSSGLSVSYSSAGGDNESIRPSMRSLDFGLNQSLRHMDTRYIENKENENVGSSQVQNHRNRRDDESHQSGYLSRTNEHDDASYWSEGLQDENSHEEESVQNSSDDPRSIFFRLLDRHCSVTTSENDEKPASVYDEYNEYSNHSKVAFNDWEPIREWLSAMTTPFGKPDDDVNHNEENSDMMVDDLEEHDPHKEARDNVLRAAILEARGRSGETVLHVACERSVPIDVLEILLGIEVPPQEQQPTSAKSLLYDNNSGRSLALCSTIDGWLPLHYACNYPNEFSVVERLVETFPEAKTLADLKGRTPLHFAMREENMNRPEVVALLACAAGIADDNGILVSLKRIILSHGSNSLALTPTILRCLCTPFSNTHSPFITPVCMEPQKIFCAS